MKPTMALKPLVFALAAIMAMAAQAGGNNGHGNGHGNNHGPKGPDLGTLLQITAGAGAAVIDTQNSYKNAVINQGTKNNASANDSLNGSSGNMGANVAAGDGNQQDNAAALATADESFIFGTAVAASSATQTNTNNVVLNQSTKNNASMNNSGNNGSGNMGVNITAGNFNQQKNNLAIAVSGGRVATAAAAANQTESGLLVTNSGVQAYDKDTLKGSIHVKGSYKGTGYGTIQGDDDHHGNGNGHGNKGGHDNDDQKFTFKEQGTVELAGYWTQQVLTPDGWKNVVTNNASLNNSANHMSGNAGINVSAGVGNQQSNSLSIAAGCKACM